MIYKPRLWVGKPMKTLHWSWSLGSWTNRCVHNLWPEDIFLPPSLERPTIDPTLLKLEKCDEVDWL